MLLSVLSPLTTNTFPCNASLALKISGVEFLHFYNLSSPRFLYLQGNHQYSLKIRLRPAKSDSWQLWTDDENTTICGHSNCNCKYGKKYKKKAKTRCKKFQLCQNIRFSTICWKLDVEISALKKMLKKKSPVLTTLNNLLSYL